MSEICSYSPHYYSELSDLTRACVPVEISYIWENLLVWTSKVVGSSAICKCGSRVLRRTCTFVSLVSKSMSAKGFVMVCSKCVKGATKFRALNHFLRSLAQDRQPVGARISPLLARDHSNNSSCIHPVRTCFGSHVIHVVHESQCVPKFHSSIECYSA